MIYVVIKDNGTEGKGAPVMAFQRWDQAFAYAKGQESSFVVYAVPMFPEIQDTPWYQIDPLYPPKRAADAPAT